MISANSERAFGSTASLIQLVRRVCEQFGIPFSENRVHPILADLRQEPGANRDGINVLNGIGTQFGFRFREIEGSFRNLLESVRDGSPVLAGHQVPSSDSEHGDLMVILEAVGRGRYRVYVDGRDEVVTRSWLKKHLRRGENRRYEFLLVQPMLAAGGASAAGTSYGSPTQPLKPLARLIAFMRPEARDIRTIVIFSMVIGLLSLTTPLAVEAVVNTIAFGRYLQPLIVLSLIVFVFLLFRAALSVLMTVVAEIIQRRLFVRTVEDLAYRLTRVPLPKWQKYHGPELVNRFFDIVTVQKVVSKLLLETLMLVLQTVIGLTVLAFYHPFLLGYDVGLLAMMTIVLFLIGRGAVRTAIEESQLKYETAAWLQEVVRHPTTFKFNGGLQYATNRADELAGRYVTRRQQHFRILIRQVSFSMFTQVVAATVLLGLGGYLVIEQQMTLGQLVAAELIVTVILGSFAKLGKDLESFYDLLASMDKLGKLFDLPIEPVDKLQLTRKPGAYDVELVDLRISPSARPITRSIEPESLVAITGGTELDRTWLVNDLIGQQVPSGGHVLLNGYRVDSLSPESLQEKICVVRDVEIFEGTIDENIRLGRPNLGSAEINSIIEQLGLGDTLASMERGLGARLSICGHPLSPSQAIRLILARALVSRPGVLFIDGLLDRLSDRDTEDVLDRLRHLNDQTTVIVATGRAMIRDWADEQIDLDAPEGGVKE